ncbi:DUF4468 domain-containing protein [Pedobacter gandavensis]|nr:DUF4468 domain-containing protein [Pedobacter gandavensis]
MKIVVMCLCFFIEMSSVFAQERKEPMLSFDDKGKYIYYEVVTQQDKSAEALKERAKAYFRSPAAPKIQFLTQDSLWIGKGKLIINKTAFVLTRPSGEVRYQLYLDFKNGKYRFWLTDFNFIPYQRDRYGNFVPATSIGIPLEQNPGKLNALEWASYLKVTAKEVQLFADKFKQTMLADTAIAIPTTKAVPVQVTKDQKW